MSEMVDDELVSIAREFRDGLLGGGSSWMMCAAVSWPLASYLRVFHDIDSEAIESDLGEMNHVWLRLSDGRALDATADQFNRLFPDMNLPPVYLGAPLPSIHALSPHDPTEKK
jgi:hypothetical protein